MFCVLEKILHYATLDGVLYRRLIDLFDHTNLPFFKRFYLTIHERHTHTHTEREREREREREKEAETPAEGETGSMHGA